MEDKQEYIKHIIGGITCVFIAAIVLSAKHDYEFIVSFISIDLFNPLLHYLNKISVLSNTLIAALFFFLAGLRFAQSVLAYKIYNKPANL